MTTARINPANFQIRSMKGFVVPFNTGKIEGHYTMEHFGLWDVANNGWVSLGSTSREGIDLPTQYSRKTWEFAISTGITPDPNLGYKVISADKLVKVNNPKTYRHA